MLKEFFDAVTEAVTKQQFVRFEKRGEEPEDVYHVLRPDGSAQAFVAMAKPRDHRAYDLDTLADWARETAAAREGDDNAPAVSVWYCRKGCVAVLDDAARRDVVRLDLAESPQVQRLSYLERNQPYFTQKDFYKLLRVQFAGCLAAHAALPDLIKKVKFRQNVAGDAEISQGKESIGRSIMRELTGTDIVPEEITLNVPVFTGVLASAFPVACAVDVDPATEKFQVMPLPGALENAVRLAEAAVGRRLMDLIATEAVKVSYGDPFPDE